LLGALLQMRRGFSEARFHLDRASALNPEVVETLDYTGLDFAYAGEPERAIGQAEQSIRLNPYFPPVSAGQNGKACFGCPLCSRKHSVLPDLTRASASQLLVENMFKGLVGRDISASHGMVRLGSNSEVEWSQ
jgi:hypothetical protein